VTETSVLGGRLVLADRVEAGRIVVTGDRIAAIEADDAEGGGPFLAPGYVDVHVHGWGGHDAMGDEASLSGMARTLASHGVTGFLPSAVTAPLAALSGFADRVRRWISTAPADGAEPLGFNLEGPFISPRKAGAQDVEFALIPGEVDRARLEALLDGLRLTTVAPELEGSIALIGWLTERGVRVSLGHSAATAAQAALGYAAGATSTTHLFNGMSGADHHDPGLAVAALTTDAAFVELIADGFHVDRALWPMILRSKPEGRVILVSDAAPLAGTGEGRGWLGRFEVEVRDDQCRLVSGGNLASSLIALDSAVRNLVMAGSASLPVAAAAAGRAPLALLGIEDRGRIAPGQRADVVELDDDLRVLRTMRQGRWIA
jgi:N-acetylglucosamine-6-phosphate deacetylase